MKHIAMAALTAALVVIGVALYRGVSSTTNDGAHTSPDSAAQIAQLQRELDAVQSGMRNLDHGQAALGRDVRSVAASEAGQPLRESLEGDERPDMSPAPVDESEAVVAMQLTVLEESLAAGTDVKWSSWAEGELASLFDADSMPDTTSVDIHCAQSLCRMELGFDADASMDEAMRALPNLMPWNAQGFFHIDAANHAVVYVSREGEELPRAG